MIQKTKSAQTQIQQAIFDLGKAVRHRKSTKAPFEHLASLPLCGSQWSNKTKFWCELSNIDDSTMFDWVERQLNSDDPIGFISAFIWLHEFSAAFSPSFLQPYIKRLACQYYQRTVSQREAA